MAARGRKAAARRELEDLRAAVRHHWEAGLCTALTPVILPEKGEPRERWLTRSEAANLLWAAWRLREKQDGKLTDRPTAQHVARFILAGLYTGTRCGTNVAPPEAYGWAWLDRHRAWCFLSSDRGHEEDQEAAAYHQDAAETFGA